MPNKRERAGRPVDVSPKGDAKDLHGYHIARERAWKNTDRPKAVRKTVLEALKVLIGVYEEEALQRQGVEVEETPREAGTAKAS